MSFKLRSPFSESVQLAMCDDEEAIMTDSDMDDVAPTTAGRRAYSVIKSGGFRDSEVRFVLLNLCKAQIGLSILFLTHGAVCPGYGDQAAYQGTCHMNVVAAISGVLTGGIGLGAINRYRWRGMMVLWLIFTIISAVATLLVVINAGVWLTNLGKLDDRTALVNGLSGILLLCAVALGVCFIITATMICHNWNANQRSYQIVGRVAKPRVFYARDDSSAGKRPDDEEMGRREMTTQQYHVCTPNCIH